LPPAPESAKNQEKRIWSSLCKGIALCGGVHIVHKHNRPSASKMEAHASLVCTLVRAGSKPARLRGRTEMISREAITVFTPGEAPPALPGTTLTVWVELPSDAGMTPRALRCIATVRTLQRLSGFWRTVLDVSQMDFVRRPGAAA
jgi:hypothetical protein